VYPPEVSEHVLAEPPLSVRPHCDAVAHSLTFTHVALRPVPESTNPAPQVHEYPPDESEHVLTSPPASARPHWEAVAHSSTLAQLAVRPLPVGANPPPHEQV
jgi:hypothetical protein